MPGPPIDNINSCFSQSDTIGIQTNSIPSPYDLYLYNQTIISQLSELNDIIPVVQDLSSKVDSLKTDTGRAKARREFLYFRSWLDILALNIKSSHYYKCPEGKNISDYYSLNPAKGKQYSFCVQYSSEDGFNFPFINSLSDPFFVCEDIPEGTVVTDIVVIDGENSYSNGLWGCFTDSASFILSGKIYLCEFNQSAFSSGTSETVLKAIIEICEKTLHIVNSLNFKQDANLKHTHSKSVMNFLNQKIKDSSDTIDSELNLSDFVSSAQTELALPSSSSTALSLYTAVQSSVDWWTDLLNLFVDFVNNLSEYSQTSKIDRILECNFDAKKFNRLLGDALNYARSNENSVLVKRNDQTYLDLNPDGQVCLDWDGGLPALVNHRHYDFQHFFQFLGKKSDGSDDLDTSFYLSKELVKMIENGFLFSL